LGAVSGLLKDPERLRVGLEAMIERKRSRLKGNPEREAATWLKKLDECARKRALPGPAGGRADDPG
jgi:hypothetical protein